MLWDVDGTLIHSAGIGAAVFDRALEKVLGTSPVSRLHLSGKTDPQIVREYLELMAVDGPDDRLPEVLAAVEAELAAAARVLAETGTTLPGVPELLAIATGRTPLDELQRLGPEVVLADLAHTEAVAAILTGDCASSGEGKGHP